jgi:hypothetical protein
LVFYGTAGLVIALLLGSDADWRFRDLVQLIDLSLAKSRFGIWKVLSNSYTARSIAVFLSITARKAED